MEAWTEESLLLEDDDDDDDFVGDGEEFLNPKLVFLINVVLVRSRSGCFSRTTFGDKETHAHEDDIATTTLLRTTTAPKRGDSLVTVVVVFSRGMFLWGNGSKKGGEKGL